MECVRKKIAGRAGKSVTLWAFAVISLLHNTTVTHTYLIKMARFFSRFVRRVPSLITDAFIINSHKQISAGDVGPFMKADNYSHQNEYRIVVVNPKRCGQAEKLNIGPINDIAIRIPATNVRNLVFKVEETE
jgi:hypothetical protein